MGDGALRCAVARKDRLHEKRIAEMATGEGKTLVSTCPLYLNALANRNVQLVTVNDYLTQRDSEWMGHLFNSSVLLLAVFKTVWIPRLAVKCMAATLHMARLLSSASIIYVIMAWPVARRTRCNKITSVLLMKSTCAGR